MSHSGSSKVLSDKLLPFFTKSNKQFVKYEINILNYIFIHNETFLILNRNFEVHALVSDFQMISFHIYLQDANWLLIYKTINK